MSFLECGGLAPLFLGGLLARLHAAFLNSGRSSPAALQAASSRRTPSGRRLSVIFRDRPAVY